MYTKLNYNKGFTLIELLIVMTIIAILSGISIFALQGSRESARDARRKGDLETVRSGLELYKSDCNVYPPTLPSPNSSLTGSSCSPSNTNVYIRSVPGDPSSGSYCYRRITNTSYELCADLENNPTLPNSCSGCANNGDYKVTNP